jgi:hypothetical protein
MPRIIQPRHAYDSQTHCAWRSPLLTLRRLRYARFKYLHQAQGETQLESSRQKFLVTNVRIRA